MTTRLTGRGISLATAALTLAAAGRIARSQRLGGMVVARPATARANAARAARASHAAANRRSIKD